MITKKYRIDPRRNPLPAEPLQCPPPSGLSNFLHIEIFEKMTRIEIPSHL